MKDKIESICYFFFLFYHYFIIIYSEEYMFGYKDLYTNCKIPHKYSHILL